MQIPSRPKSEDRRISELRHLEILDTPSEDRFDRITRLALRVFDVPMALVSLVDTDRQWFKSCQGLEASETPRDISFCGHAILEEEPLVVPDALLDPRFADNPLVLGEPSVRFYAGYPLKGPGGHTLGTLCVIDRRPRYLSAADLQALRDLAHCTESELMIARMSPAQMELIRERETAQRQAMIDPLTRAWNRGAITEILEREMDLSVREGSPLGVVLVDLDFFKRINDTHGHAAGDSLLREAVKRMRLSVRPYDAVGRYGGDEFLIVLPDCDGPNSEKLARRIHNSATRDPVNLDRGTERLSLTLGITSCASLPSRHAAHVLEAVDRALYSAKGRGRNQVAFSPVAAP